MNPKINSLFITVIILGCALGARAGEPGLRPDSTFNALRKAFIAEPPADCRPQTYVHVIDPSAVVREEALRTSRNLMDQGFNAGYPFALGIDFTATGRTAPIEDWMSDDWFHMVRELAEQARVRNRKMGFQSDHNWPVFRAGDRVQKKYPELKGGQSLRAHRLEVNGESAVKLPECLFAVAAKVDPTNGLIQSESLQLLPDTAVKDRSWIAPGSDGSRWRVFCFQPFERPGANYRVDLLNPEVGDAFIELGLEKHKQHLGEFFGNTIDTVWLDHESDMGWGMIWSQPLFELFAKKTGGNLREQLPLLLENDAEGLSAKVRWQWFDTVSDLYAANWRKVTDWAAAHGMTTGSQLWEESLTWQGSCAPDMFKLQRQFSFPSVDALQLKAAENPEHFKQTQSVAEFESRIMGVEMMALANEKFSPTTLKQSTDGAIAFGCSRLIGHSTFVNRGDIRQSRRLPDFHDSLPWWPWMKHWTDYAARAVFVAQHGHMVADVLVIDPADSVWALADEGVFQPDAKKRGPFWRAYRWDKRAQEISDDYYAILIALQKTRVEFLCADRHYLGQMDVQNGRLVRGQNAFRTVVIPPIRVLPRAVAEKVVAFAKSGGRVIAFGELPSGSTEAGFHDAEMRGLMAELQTAAGFSQIAGSSVVAIEKGVPGLEPALRVTGDAFPMWTLRKRIDGRDFHWMVNRTDKKQEIVVSGPSLRGKITKWDCETGEIIPLAVHGGSDEVPLVFQPHEAFWLVSDPQSKETPQSAATESKRLLDLDGEWAVFAAADQPPLVGLVVPETIGKPQSRRLGDWVDWGAANFSGRIEYQKRFTLDKLEGQAVWLNLGNVDVAASVTVNGKPVGQRLWAPYRFEVTGALKNGENEIRISVANTLNNYMGKLSPSGLHGPVALETITETPPKEK